MFTLMSPEMMPVTKIAGTLRNIAHGLMSFTAREMYIAKN